MRRDGGQQASLARASSHFDVHPLDEQISVGQRLAASGTFDVVDAHLAVVAEHLGTFIPSTDGDDMSRLGARYELYWRFRLSCHTVARG
ncbi:MAG: hypothetical protein OXF65_14655 [Acidimicrobiaceae bacterium]|nr:hypothetical protein [Acidimicrobiaceae bacterium]